MIPKFEICVDSPMSLQNAAQAGVDRIELCSALGLGGLTPGAGLVEAARHCGVPCHAMIRPRGGDFVFDAQDQAACLVDVAAMKFAGLAGVVIGVAHADGRLHHNALAKQIEAANGMQVTLHRVFDLTPDPFEALDCAMNLGITRVLTSGQATDAGAGTALIGELVEHAAGRIQIMAGAGVTPGNAAALMAKGVNALHASCATVTPSPQPIEHLGIAEQRDTNPDKIAALRAAMTEVLTV